MISVDKSALVQGEVADASDVLTPIVGLEDAINDLIDGTEAFTGIDIDGGTGVFSTLSATDGSGIQALNGSNITSGTVSAARVGALPASKITTGEFDEARIPFSAPGAIGDGTPGTGDFTTLTATDGSGIQALNASELDSGTVPEARIGTFAGIDVDGGAIDGTEIGQNSADLVTGTEVVGTTHVAAENGSAAQVWLVSGAVGAGGTTGFVFESIGSAMLLYDVSGGAKAAAQFICRSGAQLEFPSARGSNPATNGNVILSNVSNEFVVTDSAGNSTILSPHPQESLVNTSGRPTTHVYKETNAFTGNRVELDIYGALKALEVETGGTFVYEARVKLMDRQNSRLARYKQKRQAWRERKVS